MTCSLDLAPNAIDVWPLTIHVTREPLDFFESLLSPDEIERAQAFRFPHLTQSFILTRGCLRQFIASYLQVKPEQIQFASGPNGKPALMGSPNLKFNISHSGSLAVFAFAWDVEVGVDIEQVQPAPDYAAIARRYFSSEEYSDLMSLSEAQRELAFFLGWTRKEAFIKATGEGLSADLQSFRVSLHPEQPACFLSFAKPPQATWRLRDLAVGAGYAGALAYAGALHAIKMMPLVKPPGVA